MKLPSFRHKYGRQGMLCTHCFARTYVNRTEMHLYHRKYALLGRTYILFVRSRAGFEAPNSLDMVLTDRHRDQLFLQRSQCTPTSLFRNIALVHMSHMLCQGRNQDQLYLNYKHDTLIFHICLVLRTLQQSTIIKATGYKLPFQWCRSYQRSTLTDQGWLLRWGREASPAQSL